MGQIRGIFASIDIGASALLAQRKRLDAVAQNLANAETTRTEEGGPYKRRIVLFSENKNENSSIAPTESKGIALDYSDLDHLAPSQVNSLRNQLSGVNAEEIRDTTEPNLVYDPTHPDADERGYVAYPKINPIQEMTDLIVAARAYEANSAVISSAKTMFRRGMEI